MTRVTKSLWFGAWMVLLLKGSFGPSYIAVMVLNFVSYTISFWNVR